MSAALGRRALPLLLLGASVAFCASLAEVAARVAWRESGVSLRDPGLVLYAYYPEMWNAASERPSREDDAFDVLMLGGSVLHPDWGTVQRSIEERIFERGVREIRTFNLAAPAHTSRDSRLKYEALAEHRFDLVLFYHGVNEARTNNAPPEVFRADYSHFGWYEIVNALAGYHGRARWSLPYTLRFLSIRLRQTLAPERYVPERHPRQEWTHHGADLRSPASFEDNLRAIAEAAGRRGDPLLVATFAYHVPEDYSLERFRAKRLDYLLHLSPLELWGRPEHVVAALDAHNDVVRRVAEQEPAVIGVDVAARLPRSRETFNDAVHLTTTGSMRFAEHLVAGIPEALLAREP